MTKLSELKPRWSHHTPPSLPPTTATMPGNLIWVSLAAYFCIPVLIYFLMPKDPIINPRKRAIVLVLGDIGRSPRMQYHVLSLVETGFLVDFCGYTDTEPLRQIEECPDIKIHPIKSFDALGLPKGLPFIVLAPFKVLYQAYQLYYLLKSLKGAEYLLVQNPPAIPTMLICYIFITFTSRRTRYILDWHNFGYTVLALKLQSDTHILVRMSRWFEQWLGKLAFANFCVTKAMAGVLVRDFGINGFRIIPLPDRPAKQFVPLTEDQRAEIVSSHEIFKDFNPSTDKIVVSSTSYTPDEDMSVLLDALSYYDTDSQSRDDLPRILTIITGKGPLEPEFAAAVKSHSWKNVTIRTAWLAAEDYPRVLAAGDVGVSLHLSTSGWDLPMKVVDMFGSGVPVLARNYPALSELVVSGRNGYTFKTAGELASQLIELLSTPSKLAVLRKGAIVEGGNRWNETWRITAGPVFHIPNREDLTEIDDSSSSSDEGF
ncbi:uncharacterized protein V1518DRAFT_408267 [Limtongia smithiae]|uniref:uncharacterized protein n=1 Tax=Limtongia smithiae TaxID=1125753 RepID=UPI0034CE2D51